ncbi:hypothetical protein MWN63_00510 [Paradonghicola geojensis]|nr:hypothetical protein [Marivivens geojensis]
MLQQKRKPQHKTEAEEVLDTETLAASCTGSHLHETADDYGRIIARLNNNWRVIVCKDARQWILQRRDAQRSGRARWKAAGYFLTKSALIRASRTFCGPVAPKAVATLSALPENFVLEALK